jgi:hypothetical protein
MRKGRNERVRNIDRRNRLAVDGVIGQKGKEKRDIGISFLLEAQ